MSTSPLALHTAEEVAGTLRDWLSDKPFEWGTALATRSAFRVLPWGIKDGSDAWIEQYSLPLLQSLFIAWSTLTGPVRGHKLTAEFSAGLLYQAAMFHEKDAYFASGMRNITSAIATSQKFEKVDHSVRAAVAFSNLLRSYSDGEPPHDLVWRYLNHDIAALLDIRPARNSNVRKLMHSDLVDGSIQPLWDDAFAACLKRLSSYDPSYSFWVNWLERSTAGKHLNFFRKQDGTDAPVKDRELCARIINERSSKFWCRPAPAVNLDLQHWIDSVGVELDSEATERLPVPPQNENAISFQANPKGKIELSGALHYEALRDDRDTQDRYTECVSLAQALLDKCQGSNSAVRLTQMLSNYIEAAGSEVGSLRPSLFVQRGERLRQELAAYQNHDTLLPPISDDILLDLRALQAAHNMLVGLDAALMARDLAQLGPDVRVASATPNEIREVAVDAHQSDILANGVIDVVLEATALAPNRPDPTNRRTVWSFETGRNLVIEAFNLALRNPGKSAVGAVVATAAVSTVGAGGAVVSLAVGSLPAAKFLLRHRAWIESRLGDSPTWRSLFLSLCEWLEENTPLKNEDDR